jgi:ferredoxin/coenzyme F420-reducing hydrogenase delta subunit
VIWAGVAVFTLGLCALPWLPPAQASRAAEVFLEHCNGCARCVDDCPYAAIDLVPRTDGAPFPQQVAVDPSRCVACGICMGACPSSTPFRRSEELVTGIDLPDFPLTALREQVIAAAAGLQGPGRVLTLACAHGAAGAAEGVVRLPCVAMAPPSLIDFILSRGHADGVCIAGCAEARCQHRSGVEWTNQRFAHQRDPYLRDRVPRERVATIWAGPTETARFTRELREFRAQVESLPSESPRAGRAAEPAAAELEGAEP